MKNKEKRELIDLVSVGEATVHDLNLLGITVVEQLIGRSAEELFQDLFLKTKIIHDPCVLDVFSAAIAQAENLNLSPEKKKWWYWSRLRKKQE